MSEFDSNNQASSSQSAQAGSQSLATAGQTDPSASFNTNAAPNVPPVVLTLAEINAMQSNPTFSANAGEQCAPVAGQTNPDTASAEGSQP